MSTIINQTNNNTTDKSVYSIDKNMKKLYRYVKKVFKGDVFIDTERLSIRYVIDEDWEDMLKLFTDRPHPAGACHGHLL